MTDQLYGLIPSQTTDLEIGEYIVMQGHDLFDSVRGSTSKWQTVQRVNILSLILAYSVAPKTLS